MTSWTYTSKSGVKILAEIVPASIYYGRRTPGFVLLGNGRIVMHLSGRGARQQMESIAANWTDRTDQQQESLP